jgi:hypothetical protein
VDGSFDLFCRASATVNSYGDNYECRERKTPPPPPLAVNRCGEGGAADYFTNSGRHTYGSAFICLENNR